jgi:5-methylthioadenosine/S-adenosylhomocysteine deaminase
LIQLRLAQVGEILAGQQWVMIGGVIRKAGGKVIGVNLPKLRAQIDESRNYLFQKASYKLDIFSA